MSISSLSDRLNRVVKLAIDSGEAASITEAERLFLGYRLGIAVGRGIASSPTLQAMVLTAVNTGRRCFLGGVQVAGNLDVALLVPWQGCRTLGEAIIDLQGIPATNLSPLLPQIFVGEVGPSARGGEFVVRPTFDGWSGGVLPVDDTRRLPERKEFTPAGVLAGALAVSEAFQFVRGGNAAAGRREVGLSLWRPDAGVSWLESADRGPAIEWLPSRLWLIGLGHLGQAYLWTLGLLPYAASEEVQLVLQDYDALVEANDSTSLLTRPFLVGEKKTRAMARWCEQRGFRTALTERRFAANFTIADDEPQVALCGVDNKAARADLEDVAFKRVVEAGLGHGLQEYLAFQIHTFPAQRSARDRWRGAEETGGAAEIVDKPAYRSLEADGLDQCGLTTLAGRSVGASFVGAVASTLVIAEVLRMTLGERQYEVIDGGLRSLSHRLTVVGDPPTAPFNPGMTKAIYHTTGASCRILG